MNKRWGQAVAVATLAATLAACGSGGGSGGAHKADKKVSSGAPIKIGVVTSLTGSASSGFTTVEDGVKARLGLANATGGVSGHKLTYKMADDGSTGPGAASAFDQLVQQDKVYGVLDASSFFVGALSKAKASGLPIVGESNFSSGINWQDKSLTNLFDASGYQSNAVVPNTWGTFFKGQGATKLAAVAYGSSPQSVNVAKQAIKSTSAVGMKPGFLDTSLAFGSTDVGPVVQAIVASKADAVYLPLVPNSDFAIAAGLQRAGAHVKSVLLATGYGGDLLKSSAGVQAGQNIQYLVLAEPQELNTPATTQMKQALAKYAGYTSVPTFGQYVGWLEADAFIAGLKAAGPNASAAQFISKLRSSTWTAGGLQKPVNFTNPKPLGLGMSPGNCIWVVKLEGRKFVPVPKASPVCGTPLK